MFSTVILCTMVKRVYNKELHCNFISAQQETGAEVKRRRTKAKKDEADLRCGIAAVSLHCGSEQ